MAKFWQLSDLLQQFKRYKLLSLKEIVMTKFNFSGAPEKPRKFVIQETSDNSQTFKWTQGFNGGYPQTFEILYQVLGKENEGWKIATVTTNCKDSNDCNYTVGRLASATTYTFKVCAQNKVGPANRDDACSEIIQATTYAATPVPGKLSISFRLFYSKHCYWTLIWTFWYTLLYILI